MAGFYYEMEKSGMTNGVTFATKLVETLTAGGGVAWFEHLTPAAGISSSSGNTTTTMYLLRSTQNVDSFAGSGSDEQKYRILVELVRPTNSVGGAISNLRIHVGTANQIYLNNGNVFIDTTCPTLQVLGAVNASVSNLPALNNEVNARIVLSDRGFAISVWPTSLVNSTTANFFGVVQRPVNPADGMTKTAGTAPVFVMWRDYNFTPIYFRWGVVREFDVESSTVVGNTGEFNHLSSSPRNSRTIMFRTSLDWSHPNLFDNGSHVVKFPYGFATTRHLYLEELDLCCIVNGGAFASNQDVNITMYGEETQRTYKTTWGEVNYGYTTSQISLARTVAGGRIGVLAHGGGLPAAPAPAA